MTEVEKLGMYLPLVGRGMSPRSGSKVFLTCIAPGSAVERRESKELRRSRETQVFRMMALPM